MNWVRKGLIFNESHAQLPTALVVGNKITIFYSKKLNNISYIMSIDISLSNPKHVLSESILVLSPGEHGCFDDSGVMPSSVFIYEGLVYLYYTGWHRRKSVPYGQAIGLAISEDGKKFKRISKSPVLSLGPKVPYLANSAVVSPGKQFSMYFCNGAGWEGDFATYGISNAVSVDGIEWSVGDVVIESSGRAVSRISRFKDILIFAHKIKNSPYQLSVELVGKPEAWESEATCYPCVVNDKIMLYNGNGYGATGFGYAEFS